jgi:hypothetical protein
MKLSVTDMPAQSILTAVAYRLAHYGRTLPGGIRYLAKRTPEAIRDQLLEIRDQLLDWSTHILEATKEMLQPEENPNPLLIPHIQLQKLIQTLNMNKGGAFDVTTIGEVWRYAPPPPSGTRVVQMSDPSAGTGTHEFNIRIPQAGDSNGIDTLVIYAEIDFLFRWDRLEEDLDRFLADGRRQVIIVLIVPGFRLVDIAGHSYLLSIFLSSIPGRKFAASLEVYVGPKTRRASERPLIRSLRLLAGDAWQTLRGVYANISRTGVRAPTSFSALVISVQPQLGSDIAP